MKQEILKDAVLYSNHHGLEQYKTASCEDKENAVLFSPHTGGRGGQNSIL